MSRTKEFNVEVKKSRNYQTYTAGEVVILEEGDDLNTERLAALTRCRKAVQEQIKIDTPGLSVN